MVKILGLLGGFCFAFCGVPPALNAIKMGSTSVPRSTAWLVFMGGVFMYAYLLFTYGFDLVLFVNYAIEIASWGIIVRYQLFPRVRPRRSSKGKTYNTPHGKAQVLEQDERDNVLLSFERSVALNGGLSSTTWWVSPERLERLRKGER